MDHSKKSTYLFSIDALRVISILAVILIHSTTKTLQVLDHNVLIAPATLLLNQLSRFAVPLFFLISGLVLELNNKEGLTYITFFKKRASRIVIPFLFWSTLYFFVGWGYSYQKIFSFSFLQNLFFGSSSYHLYFIPTLILFYLAFPLLHAILGFLKNPVVLTCIVIFQLLIQFKDYYYGQLDIQPNLRIALLSFSMFVIGMVVSHSKDKILIFIKKRLNFLVSLLLIAMAVIFIHVRDITLTKHTSGYIYNQYGPLNYIYTFLLFAVLFYFLEKTHFLRHLFINLSKLSFFVFFIHVFILDIAWYFVITWKIALTQFWFDIVFFLLISTICFGLAYIIHRIPWASKITG